MWLPHLPLALPDVATAISTFPFVSAQQLATCYRQDISTVYRELAPLLADGTVKTITIPSVGSADRYYLTPHGIGSSDADRRFALYQHTDPWSLLARLPSVPQTDVIYSCLMTFIEQVSMVAMGVTRSHQYRTRMPRRLPDPKDYATLAWQWHPQQRITGRDERSPYPWSHTVQADCVCSVQWQEEDETMTLYWRLWMLVDDDEVPEAKMRDLLRHLVTAQRDTDAQCCLPSLCIITTSVPRYALWQQVIDHLPHPPIGTLILQQQHDPWPFVRGGEVNPVSWYQRCSVWEGVPRDPTMHFPSLAPCYGTEIAAPWPEVPEHLPQLHEQFYRDGARDRDLADWVQYFLGRSVVPPRVQRAVLALMLTRRQQQALVLATLAPQISLEDVGQLFAIAADSVRRLLSDLVTLGLVELVPIQVRPAQAIPGYAADGVLRVLQTQVMTLRVTELGYGMVAGMYPQLRVWQRSHATPTIHDTACLRFLVAWQREAHQLYPPASVWWHVGPGSQQRYPVTHESGERTWHALYPDGYGLVVQGDGTDDVRFRRFWVEWDRGTMREEQLADKVCQYQDLDQYLSSWGSRKRYPTSGQMWGEEHGAEDVFAHVIFIAPTTTQAGRISRLLRAETWQRLHFWVGTYERLIQQSIRSACVSVTEPKRPFLDLNLTARRSEPKCSFLERKPAPQPSLMERKSTPQPSVLDRKSPRTRPFLKRKP